VAIPRGETTAKFNTMIAANDCTDLIFDYDMPVAMGFYKMGALKALDMDKVRRGPRPIFLDFTAAWCMNCRFNERTVLETEATAAILAQHNYLAIKADFTQQNDTIFMWLKRFGRSGVPLYLVIPPCAEDNKVLVLPELLTASSLHEALHKGAASGSCTEQSAAGQ